MNQSKSYALITGATSGIGYELAKLFAQDGYNLVIVARNEEELQRTATELKENGIEVICLAKDLFKQESVPEIYSTLQAKNIAIEILVNNAGQGLYGEFVDTELQRELDIIQLNIASLVVFTKYFLRDMVKNGSGKILNLSSMASKSPGPWQSVYHGTKAFVQSFTEAIRAEVKDKGITVTALLPGITDTDFFNKAGMNESKALQGDKASPADVAKDGYTALMDEDDMVVSGLGNKIRAAATGVIPDHSLAEKTYKDQAPVQEDQH